MVAEKPNRPGQTIANRRRNHKTALVQDNGCGNEAQLGPLMDEHIDAMIGESPESHAMLERMPIRVGRRLFPIAKRESNLVPRTISPATDAATLPRWFLPMKLRDFLARFDEGNWASRR